MRDGGIVLQGWVPKIAPNSASFPQCGNAESQINKMTITEVIQEEIRTWGIEISPISDCIRKRDPPPLNECVEPLQYKESKLE